MRIVSHGTNDWGPDDVARLHATSQPLSRSLGGSVVRDAGYSLGQSDIADDRPPEQTFVLSGLGTQFETYDTRTDHVLEKLLRSKRVPCAERRNLEFLPINELERIMTPENIYLELLCAGVSSDIQRVTESLCRRGKQSRQRIFAILCMLRMAAQIVEFELEGIYDGDLPFIFRNTTVYRGTNPSSKRSTDVISLFQSSCWEPVRLESFEKYQGQLTAPIFKFAWAAGEKVLHFPLKDQLVLPFMHVEETSNNGELGASIQRQGGTSIVRKVKIHPAHYNASPETVSGVLKTWIFADEAKVSKADLCFAVKELQVLKDSDKPHGADEDREAVTLKRLNEQRDPHLIRLLATYTYDSRFHLIFPWADGNLKDLWAMPFHQPSARLRDAELVRWMSTQILGLACALQKIHYCPIDEPNIQGLPSHAQERPHGRHGDLKPENILWFKDTEDADGMRSMGMLQIADFGFADFHTKHSRSKVRRSTVSGFTDTYKAPEYDVSQWVSPRYDIWSFGCILLQFIVWYLRGWEGVDDFSKARSADSKGAPIEADIFFGLEVGSARDFKARAKLSVVKVSANKLDIATGADAARLDVRQPENRHRMQ